MRVPIVLLASIFGPVRAEYDACRIVITHLQKYSRCGFLMTWPFCFHLWFFWKKQAGNDEEGWVPGSESGIYMRTPGFRYDFELGMKWTWGYIGGHWD